jgi:hypothetical protein
MQTTKQSKRKVGVPRSVKGRKQQDTGVPQHGSGGIDEGPGGLSQTDGLQRTEIIHPSGSTGSLNISGLTFQTKMGFDIIKNYGVPLNFSRKEKIKALMLYNCLKHLPGFDDREFSDVNEAVKHVYHEDARLIKFPHGFVTDYNDYTDTELPETYLLQICYDVFTADEGRWQSYDNVLKVTRHDKQLQNAVLMCMNLIIYQFGFTLFDAHGGEMVQNMPDWSVNYIECLSGDLEHYYDEFLKAQNRNYDPKKDKDHADAKDIVKILKTIENVDTAVELYENKIVPLQDRITEIKVNVSFINKIAEKYKDQDIGDWLFHILMLFKKGFSVNQYVGDSFRQMGDIYDENSISPMCAYGYIHNGDSIYAKSINEDYQQYAENYCIVPFVLNKVIDPKKGVIYETENVPLGAWVNKIFALSFLNLKYEQQ